MPHNSEESELNETTHVTIVDTCMTLDTIQEAKEGSSLSGDSSENLQTLTQSDPVPETTTTTTTTLISKETQKEEKKIKVQLMNDEDEDDDDDDEEEGGMLAEETLSWIKHPDIDRGWAWVVLLAIFLIFCVCAGLLACTGLYYVQMLKEFKQSRSYTAWMGSLMNAFYTLAGPICSAVIKKTGCRTSIILGGIIMSVGYLMSALAYSLPVIFLTYGVVVATGMNFVYSGQIIALAQYFYVHHSLATSLSMVGVGVGMFSMIRVIEFIVLEYGWRISFVYCAAFSLHVCIFGSLIFPLNKKNNKNVQVAGEVKESFSQESIPYSPPSSRKLFLNKEALLNRSVSSLRLSMEAGYLSSSFSNLEGDFKPGTSSFTSNQHSFCSRGSQYLGGIRSNQHSFSQFANGDFPVGLLPFLKSNQHSFCSRGSSYGIHSLKSNPQSFSNKNSQTDLHHIAYHHCLPALKDLEGEQTAEGKEFSTVTGNKQFGFAHSKESEIEVSKCNLLLKKVQNALKGIMSDWHFELLLDPCFWLLNIAMFFTFLATVKLFVIYKDLSETLGVGDYYPFAMSILGMGDIIGRIFTGIVSSYKWVNSILFHALAVTSCGVIVGFHITATWGPSFLMVAGLFGFFSGQQNVLITFVPSTLFGKEMLLTVFGYILFFAGLGALFGAPLAGCIVDNTGSYNGVILLSFSCSVVAGFCMLGCYWITRRRQEESRSRSPSYV